MRPDIQAGGYYFNFLHPEKSRIEIHVVAASLSKLCRFTGHCIEFYSVAQHAVLASYLTPPEYAFEALCHDNAESVLGDVSSPLKRLLPEYKALERRVEPVFRAWQGLPAEMSAEVKRADLVMLATEKRDLMPRLEDDATVVVDGFEVPANRDDPWALLVGITPAPFPITPWDHVEAEHRYLNRYFELRGA